jgi:hypothetical protein
MMRRLGTTQKERFWKEGEVRHVILKGSVGGIIGILL